MADESKQQQYVNVLLDEALIEKIDDFRYGNRFPSRTEAIRWLLNAAIEKKLKPAKPAAAKTE
jgi:metal-responsive CopG/Arc/MetJ family transcriptional regulator